MTHPRSTTSILALATALVSSAACTRTEQRGGADTTTAAVATGAGPLVVTEHGIGPLRAGMTLAEADAALGGTLDGPAAGAGAAGGCDYAAWRGGPTGVSVMVEDGRIARVEVDSGPVATAEGARIGDGEDRVRTLYAGRVTVTPHKYTDGRYLTVKPAAPADSGYAIVFETDGQGRVTQYRAGAWPAVGYVEGCG